MKSQKCQGECCEEKENFDTKLVEVFSLSTNLSWGTFWYCPDAIRKDEKGFDIKIREPK